MVMGLPFSGGIHACLVLDVNSEFEGEVMDTRHFIYRQCCIECMDTMYIKEMI